MLYYFFNISYYKIRGYYLILYNLIQNKMKYLSKEEIKENKLRSLEKKEEDDLEDFPDMPNQIYNLEDPKIHFSDLTFFSYANQELTYKVSLLNSFFDSRFTLSSNFLWNENIFKFKDRYWFSSCFYKDNGIFIKNKEGSIWKSVFTDEDFEIGVNIGIVMDKNKTSISLNSCIDIAKLNINKNKFVFPFPLLSWLEFVIAIIPSVNIKTCLNLGLYINWESKQFTSFIDISGKAEVGITLDFGLYIPKQDFFISISVNIGIHGILGSGAVGVKLILYLNKNLFIVDTYFQIIALQFTFYILLRITLHFDKSFLKIFKLENITYEFIIYSYKFASLINYEYHIQRGYTYNKSKEIPGLCKNKGSFKMNFFELKTDIAHGGVCKIL